MRDPATAFTLPWPLTKLSPNARTHWAERARLAKVFRKACYLTALSQGAKKIQADRLAVHLVFVPPNRRERDWDNLIASMKAGLDGLSDAIGVDDARWRLSFEVAEGEIGGMVRVKIEVLNVPTKTEP